jgi:hypothetical protein
VREAGVAARGRTDIMNTTRGIWTVLLSVAAYALYRRLSRPRISGHIAGGAPKTATELWERLEVEVRRPDYLDLTQMDSA